MSSKRPTWRWVKQRISPLPVAITMAMVAGVAGGPMAAAAPASAAGLDAGTSAALPLTAADAAALSRNATTPVIVVMKDQPAEARKGSVLAARRAVAMGAQQASLLGELRQVKARQVHSFRLINAIAATVSKAEAARLAANPDVRAVIPDSPVQVTPQPGAATPPSAGKNRAAATSKAARTKATSAALPTGTCPAAGQTMLEPEALSDTHTDSDDPNAQTARSLGFTGAGVRVGFIAGAIDPNNPDFIRPDGGHVIAGYQDFSGEGLSAPGVASESFIDASAIAAQGREVFNVQNFGSPPLPSPCDIRIEGMAPGVGLYAYKVEGVNVHTTLTQFVQAVDYAVNVDHVDVLNESFFDYKFPSNELDILRMANDAAVAAGVTVVASSSDMGTANTEADPANNPNVISVGASTNFRWYQQTNYAGARQFAPNGWVNDNVSAISSAGINQDARTIDLLAPGDGSFADCTPNTGQFLGCADFLGNPSSVVRSGGTSESAPLTAGAAALVIQAYRQAHGGASPSPALVKQIITGTADDLTLPGDEQGAGLLDSYHAVQAALSVHDANGSPQSTGQTLLTSQNQLTATAAPGTQQNWNVAVTNTGAGAQTVHLSGRSFGAPRTILNTPVTLSDANSSHFSDWQGVDNNYETTTFTVPAGTDRLSASIAYQSPPNAGFNARVRLDLIDPTGRLAAHSIPQGVSNFGDVDVRFPSAGTWTAIVFSRVSTVGGTVGTVQLQAATSNTAGFGSVTPDTLTLAPGQTGTVTVTANTPAQPGDVSGSLVLKAGGSQQTSVPITLRSLIDPASGGAFQGVLTGGNGDVPDIGQSNFYEFNVPPGKHDLDVSVDLTNDPADTVIAVLVNPDGLIAAVGANRLATSYDAVTRSGTLQNLTQTDLYARAPQAGRWKLLIDFAGAIVGDEVSQQFNGTVSFDKVQVGTASVRTKPATARAAAGGRHATAVGQPVAIAVPVTNTGTAPEDFFLDPRLNTTATVNLTPVEPTQNLPLPLTFDHVAPAWLVPSETSQVTLSAQATVPAKFEYGPQLGDPDVLSATSGTSPAGSITGNPLPSGVWASYPAEIGPFGADPAPAGSISMNMTATTQAFDPNTTSQATDLWQMAVNPVPSMKLVTLQPGQSGVLIADITPTASPGTTVTGTLYVDTLTVGSSAAQVGEYSDAAPTQPSASELAAVPYSYKIG